MYEYIIWYYYVLPTVKMVVLLRTVIIKIDVKVALQWAAALGGPPGARLLAARGLAALGARWALQAQRFFY